MAKPPPDPAATAPGTSAAQMFVSVLLFAHLFCIFVSLSSNLSASQFEARLLAALRPYIQLLNFELDFTPYHLTSATNDDVDHRIEALPAGKNPDDPAHWIVLPSHGPRFAEDYKRYQRLAKVATVNAEQEAEASTAEFARSVSRHMLLQDKIRPSQIRFRKHMLQGWEDVVPRATPARRNPNDASYFETSYAANVLIDEADNVDVLKTSGRSETAQPTSPTADGTP